jgi:Flp pilus assembly protein TadG
MMRETGLRFGGKDNEKGAVAIVVALLLTVFIGVAALAVDVGYMMVAKNELQNVADAAALAATRRLGAIYEPMVPSAVTTYICAGADETAVKLAATQVALSNKVAGSNAVIDSADVEIGNWTGATKTFVATPNQPDAVRVTAKRVGTSGIGTFFATFFGRDKVPVWAEAVAALSGESTSGPGGLPIPIGIPTRWFTNPTFCGSRITFYPPCNKEPCTAADGCAGYTTFTDSPASASFIRNTIMPGIPSGTYTSPATTAGVTKFNFTGGTLATLMNPPDYAFITLFNAMKGTGPSATDMDSDPTTWTAKVVVYDADTCANPNKSLTVVGFTTIVITDVVGPPNPRVEGYVVCDNIDAGRGGGGEYGTKSSIPGLVK